MQRALAATATLVLIAALGCSQPAEDTAAPPAPKETPEDVARRVLDAAIAQDEAAFLDTLTAKAREGMASDDGGFGGQEYDSYEVGDVTIENGEASVPVDAVMDGETESLTLKMRQENGAWKLYAMAMEMMPGNTMTVNFEEFGDMMQQMADGIGEALGEAMSEGFEQAFSGPGPEEVALNVAMFDALEPVSVEAFEASWKLSENYAGQPRADALAAIAEPLQMTIHAGDHAEALADAVETDTTGLSRLEAIERIANETGLHSVMPNLQDYGIGEAFVEGMAEMLGAMFEGDDAVISVDGEAAQAVKDELSGLGGQSDLPANAVTFTATMPKTAPAFVGPFRIELADVQENVPHASGQLFMHLTAYGLPPAVLNMLEKHDDSFQVNAVENVAEEALIDLDMMYMGGGQVFGSAYFDTAVRELTGLLRSVDTIALIDGAVEVPLPTSVEEFEFDSLAPGDSKTVNGITIALQQHDASTSFKVTGPEAAVEGLEFAVQPYGADGEPVVPYFSDYMSFMPGEGQLQFQLDEKPSSVRVKMIAGTELMTYPYAFKDIRLEHATEQPKELAKLAFEGDAPLKIAFQEIVERDENFTKVKLTIENVSNKVAETAFVDFVYFDAGGSELESFPVTLMSPYDADGWEPGGTVESEETAFGMPPEADSIQFQFNVVEFADGTSWEPDTTDGP